MTIPEYMRKYELTYKQVFDRINKGLIPAVKVGKAWKITLDAPAAVEPHKKNTLKDELTAVQIKKIKQQLEEGRLDLV